MSDSCQQWLFNKQQEWESLCRHCGACCGAFEDPCEHLHIGKDGRSLCREYDHRLGAQKTVSGQPFQCVNIRQKFGQTWPGGDHCSYHKIL